jgi:hypothetical protein
MQPISGTFQLQRLGSEEGPFTFDELQMQLRAGTLKADTPIRKTDGSAWFPAKELPGLFSDKQWLIALLLSVLVGSFGVDRMYLGQIGLGIIKLVTCGGFGIWWIIDIILIATNKVTDNTGLPLTK